MKRPRIRATLDNARSWRAERSTSLTPAEKMPIARLWRRWTKRLEIWWEDELELFEPQGIREDGDTEPYRKTAADLKRFIESEALSWYSRRQREIEYLGLLSGLRHLAKSG